jgi:hypothetical protein
MASTTTSVCLHLHPGPCGGVHHPGAHQAQGACACEWPHSWAASCWRKPFVACVHAAFNAVDFRTTSRLCHPCSVLLLLCSAQLYVLHLLSDCCTCCRTALVAQGCTAVSALDMHMQATLAEAVEKRLLTAVATSGSPGIPEGASNAVTQWALQNNSPASIPPVLEALRKVGVTCIQQPALMVSFCSHVT